MVHDRHNGQRDSDSRRRRKSGQKAAPIDRNWVPSSQLNDHDHAAANFKLHLKSERALPIKACSLRTTMRRWSGLLKVPVCPNSSTTCYKVAVSLCFCPESKSLIVPSANAIFFNGDRVEGTGNPIIEKLSDPQQIADILASKFPYPVNTWIILASTFNGPFAVYKDFIPSVNRFGEPKGYYPDGFPASTSTISLLSSCLKEVKNVISRTEETCISMVPSTSSHHPKTILLGFSKGGTVVNQLVTELSFSEPRNLLQIVEEETQLLPTTTESLLSSITDIHYVDVGLNAPGAYITDGLVIRRIGNRVTQGTSCMVSFSLHGTPRQWCDHRRGWIREEKKVMMSLLESESLRVEAGKFKVCEKLYFAHHSPDLQMHFQIIEELDLCVVGS